MSEPERDHREAAEQDGCRVDGYPSTNGSVRGVDIRTWLGVASVERPVEDGRHWEVRVISDDPIDRGRRLDDDDASEED